MRQLFTKLLLVSTFVTAMTFFSAELVYAFPAQQKGFASPEDASKALLSACLSEDAKDLVHIFGADFLKHISSGDPVADKLGLARLAERMQARQEIVSQPDGSKVIEIGDRHWPFPAALVEKKGLWYFDSQTGIEEILDRRIGEQELRAIDVCDFYSEAQQLYKTKDRDGDGFLEYAQHLISSPGSKNGLYWEHSVDQTPSPFYPIVRVAIEEGYDVSGKSSGTGYHGYRYEVLSAQGSKAAGGAKSYITSAGRMTEGFALLAYPARWGSSGIMSFMVGPDGVVYQKNLGSGTSKIASRIHSFNPDSSWQKIRD